MDDDNPMKKRRTAKKDIESERLEAASAAAASVRSMHAFVPMAGDRKENFRPRILPPHLQRDLVANNPFDDSQPQSFERPTPQAQPPAPTFVRARAGPDPTQRRGGFPPDQIGNMSYTGYMQPNPNMAYPPNQFEHPSMGPVNPMNMHPPMNNVPLGQIGNGNNLRTYRHGNQNGNQMMNPRTSRPSMNGGRMIQRPPPNSGVGGLAMNGSSTLINQIPGSSNGSRANPANQMMGNRVSPVRPVANVPNLRPLLSPDHMHSAMNMPPMNPMDGAHHQQYSNQMNNAPGHMQGPPDMSMQGPPNMSMQGPPNMHMQGPPNMHMQGPPNMQMHAQMQGPPNMQMHEHMQGPPNMHMHEQMQGPPNMQMHEQMQGPPNMHMPGPHNMHLQGLPNMPMPSMNPTMATNNQMNNMDMPGRFDGAPDINTMNGNERHQMPLAQYDEENPLMDTLEQIMARTVQNFTSVNLPGQEGNEGIREIMNANPTGATVGSETRIFPPNQPMVFDDKNPQAPPIAPCGICRREVQATDQAIFCESGCNFWYHRKCVGLTEFAHQLLMNEPCTEWVCDKCLVTKQVPLVKFKL